MTAAITMSAGPTPLRCPDGSRPRLLLAEDSDAARILTAALIERMGCEVDAVEHGEDALAKARLGCYDLILLDIEMPVMDGVAAARGIRALDGPAARTPLMALSAFLADSSKTFSWREEFDFALAKPAGRAELRQAIAAVLADGKDAPDSKPVAKQPREPVPPLFDAEALERMSGGFSAQSWSALLGLVGQEIMACIAEIETSRLPDAQHKAAHKLQGIAMSFAAPRLAAMAKAIETQSSMPENARLRVCAAETLAAMKAPRP